MIGPRIIAVLVDDLGWDGDPAELDADVDLIEEGILDSLRLVEFVNLLEHRFGIQLGDDEIVADNFRTIAVVEALVAEKLG